MKQLNTTYPPVGHCIYCSSIMELTKEHIVPFGLSGKAILPKASCKACAKITGSFEQKVLRGAMWAARVYRKLSSRTNHADAPESYPVTLTKNGKKITLYVPIEDYPILLHFPIFTLPAQLEPEGYIGGIRIGGLQTISFGTLPNDFLKKYEAEAIEGKQISDATEFARMLAKIAFSWAIAENKLNLIQGSSFVLPAILGKTDDIGRWVGKLNDEPVQRSNLLHYIAIREDYVKNLLIAEIHLFCDSQTPNYQVILGKLHDRKLC